MQLKLNLGAGKDYRDGFINTDIANNVGADKVFDMEEGIPFKDNYFDEIIAYNCLEQISTPKKFVFVIQELHRILKPTGFLVIRVPNVTDICAFQDIFDILKFNKDSFTYMDVKHPRYKEFGMTYGYPPFNLIPLKIDRQLTFRLEPIK